MCLSAFSQQKVWISHADTNNLCLPKPEFCSSWLPYCSYSVSEDVYHTLGSKALPVQLFKPATLPISSPVLGFALEQIEAKAFLQEGLNGAGIKIGIIDGGFLKANKSKSLKHVFEAERVKNYQDFVTPELTPYDGIARLDDGHGTEVWQLIGGKHPGKNIQYGLATHAEYYLARTDHGAYEKRIEEDHLIAALEQMHRMGVRLVNVSLGYNIGYTNPEENYRREQMDGKSTLLAKTISAAALEKGMLIIVAAGNEALDPWQIVSTPGDAEHALTVGASKFDIWDKMNYSSIGPSWLPYVKPDIAVYASSGTSYAAPVVTGMAACIWQRDSTLSNFEVMDLLKSAGNFHPYANNYLGHGVPTCTRILKLMDGQTISRPNTLRTKKKSVKIPLKTEASYVVAFHKTNEKNVANRYMYRNPGETLKIKRPDRIRQTSLLVGKEVLEIFWE
ncbi:subtilase family protein [Marinoscillum furvescens DSM 4134]|uniref:Subtilase family protein n=1 Tax=Marinoscillum furvescens DSM 4134 TaxID=1122208 RepID=A0A3D9LID6_MARFU|nr:subtilase family protein [Marinoscillum furvescens DSM 4134]